MIKAMNGLHEEFMQDRASASYVGFLERKIHELRMEIAELERERGAMEHAAQVNHALWCQANQEANELGAALMAAQSALRAGDAGMAARILEA